MELLEIEVFDQLNVCIYKMFANHMFNLYVKTGFGIK